MIEANDVANVVQAAQEAAQTAARAYFNDVMKGTDQFPCGFAWVEVSAVNDKKIRGNSKIGKALKAAGLRQMGTTREYSMWNPSRMPVQNVDTLSAGADAAAEVFREFGFDAYSLSRWD